MMKEAIQEKMDIDAAKSIELLKQFFDWIDDARGLGGALTTHILITAYINLEYMFRVLDRQKFDKVKNDLRWRTIDRYEAACYDEDGIGDTVDEELDNLHHISEQELKGMIKDMIELGGIERHDSSLYNQNERDKQ